MLTSGVHKVICTCDNEMTRTGGMFGGDSPTTDTYYCHRCRKHVVVVTPRSEEQKEFSAELDYKKLMYHDTH